eukprot:6181182-Prymnesium_polylepis.1
MRAMCVRWAAAHDVDVGRQRAHLVVRVAHKVLVDLRCEGRRVVVRAHDQLGQRLDVLGGLEVDLDGICRRRIAKGRERGGPKINRRQQRRRQRRRLWGGPSPLLHYRDGVHTARRSGTRGLWGKQRGRRLGRRGDG